MLGIALVFFVISGVYFLYSRIFLSWGWGTGFAFLLYGLLANNDD